MFERYRLLGQDLIALARRRSVDRAVALVNQSIEENVRRIRVLTRFV